MQRKNRILKSTKNGIAMVMAIAVIVIIATIMALSLSLTSQTTKKTADLYLYEQAVLLSKSATEYALLRIARDNNSSRPCFVTGFNFVQDKIYDINVSISYVYTAGAGNCTPTSQYITITTPEQNGSALIDVAVSVNDAAITAEQIRYFKRTMQKL